jgi:hypothetical protein
VVNILETLSTLGTPGENTANPDLNARLRTLITRPAAEIPAGLPISRNQPDTGSTQSILNALRKRVLGEFEGEQARQAADLGRGLLASRSPNFFTALGEGLAVQEAGSASRMDRLRQAAEAERQQRALEVEETRRREELRLREQEVQANAPFRAAQTEQARALAEFYRAGGSGSNRPASGQITPARIAQLTMQAQVQALRDIPDPDANSVDALRDTPAERLAREERRRRRAEQLIEEALARAGHPGSTLPPTTSAAPAAPAVPVIEVSPVGRPTR